MRGNKRHKVGALVLVFSLLAFNIHTTAQKIYNYHDKQFVYRLAIDSALSGDSVNYRCSVKSIRIFRRSDHRLIQAIYPPENYFFSDLCKDEIFVVEDMNFDGMNDIRSMQFIPAAPNTPYYYWIFNKATGKFQRNKALENITTPEFDHKQKLIFSSWRGGWDDRGSSTYKIIGGRPVLVEEYEIKGLENDSTKRVETQKKRIKGKMRLVKRTVENISDDK